MDYIDSSLWRDKSQKTSYMPWNKANDGPAKYCHERIRDQKKSFALDTRIHLSAHFFFFFFLGGGGVF